MSEAKSKETTIASLFEQLEEFGAGSIALTSSDTDGNVLTCIIVAKGENAKDIMTYYDQEDARNSATFEDLEP